MGQDIKFSIIIPARDEEKYIGKCLESIGEASKSYPNQVEVIVVINRCTDRTEEIARAHNAIIVRNDSKCLSKIRNAGARAARGEILITIDADSTMSPNMLVIFLLGLLGFTLLYIWLLNLRVRIARMEYEHLTHHE